MLSPLVLWHDAFNCVREDQHLTHTALCITRRPPPATSPTATWPLIGPHWPWMFACPPRVTHIAVCVRIPDTVTSVMSHDVVTTFTMRMKTHQSRHPFQTIETTFLKYGGHILLFKINRNRNAFSAKDTAWIDLRQILSVHSKEHIQDIKIQ